MHKKNVRAGDPNKYSRLGLGHASAAFFVLVAAIFPLYITRTHYMTMGVDKFTFFIVSITISAIAILLVLFFTTTRLQPKDYFMENEPKRPLSVTEWALIAFVLFAFLSTIFSPYGNDFIVDIWSGGEIGRFEGFWTFLSYGITFFILARYFRPKKLHFIIFAVSASLLSLYGILQFLDMDFLMRSGFFLNVPPADNPMAGQILAPLTRVFRTTLGNINIVTGYASLTLVLFAGLFAGEDSKKGYFYLAASALAFMLLLITRGDAGRLGVLGAMVLAIPYWLANRQRLGKIFIVLASWGAMFAIHNLYLAWLKNRAESIPMAFEWDNMFLQGFSPMNPILLVGLVVLPLAIGLCLLLVLKKWPEKPMKIAGIALLGLMAVGALLFVEIEGARREGPHDIIWQAREMLRGRAQDEFGSARVVIWRQSLNVIPDNPLLGTGPATFHLALGEQFQNESVERFGVFFDSAHNTYLQIAVTLGIPALIAYLTFLGSLFWSTLKRAFDRPILLAFAAGSVAYLIQSFFQIDILIDRPILWVCLGIMAGEIWRGKIGADSYYDA